MIETLPRSCYYDFGFLILGDVLWRTLLKWVQTNRLNHYGFVAGVIMKKDQQERRLGPLVAYAGTYDSERRKHYVGDVYYNFALVEEHPNVLDCFAQNLGVRLARYKITAVVAAPLGGIGLAQALARILQCRFLYAEKEILEIAETGKKEKSKLIWGRHQVEAGDAVIIVEDVCNNFSTTEKLWKLITDCSARVVVIVCALNRSGQTSFVIIRPSFCITIPVISVINKPLVQYRQEDPEIVRYILGGNVIWDPKKEWSLLQEIMERQKTRA